MKILVNIFGSTGDLSARKLLPALIELKKKAYDIHILAIGRRPLDTMGYLTFMQEKTKYPLNMDILKDMVTYVDMQMTEPTDYQKLKKIQQPFLTGDTKRLYYMAVGPEHFEVISQALYDYKLIKKNDVSDIVAFEKPFGEDLLSAQRINLLLSKYFTERQMFRIDHYLGKEMIQNIMMLRFANRILEDSWHNRSIRSIKIYVKEKEGILARAGYYDQIGALRDMMQSHVLQIVSLLTMDVPKTYLSDDVKDEKVDAIKHLKINHEHTILGQYEGYLDEDNIPAHSKTETFVFLEGMVLTPKFKGIPIYMLTGKKLGEKCAYIDVEFEATSEQRKWDLPLSSNILRISIAPEDGFHITLNAKVPGLRNHIEPVNLGYEVDSASIGNLPEAYEKLFADMFGHHRTLFTRWDEIEASWAIIDAVIREAKTRITYRSFEDIQQQIFDKTGVKI